MTPIAVRESYYPNSPFSATDLARRPGVFYLSEHRDQLPAKLFWSSPSACRHLMAEAFPAKPAHLCLIFSRKAGWTLRNGRLQVQRQTNWLFGSAAGQPKPWSGIIQALPDQILARLGIDMRLAQVGPR